VVRTLSSGAQAEALSSGAKPRNLVKLMAGGALGTRWFSDSEFTVPWNFDWADLPDYASLDGAMWKFDEGSGVTADNEEGTAARDLTLSASGIWDTSTPDPFGGTTSLKFTGGTSNYHTDKTDEWFDLDNEQKFTFIINAKALSDGENDAGCFAEMGNGTGWLLFFLTPTVLRFNLDTKVGTTIHTAGASFPAPSLNAWHSIAIVVDLTQATPDEQVVIYVDGVAQTITWQGSLGTHIRQTGTKNLAVGNYNGGGPWLTEFDGNISQTFLAIGEAFDDYQVKAAVGRMDARVVNWGLMDRAIVRGNQQLPVTDMKVQLQDHDRSLLSYFDDIEVQDKPVAMYQFWTEAGLLETDLVTLIDGFVSGPFDWDENNRKITLDLVSKAVHYNRTVGVLATIDDFPDIAENHEGRMIPICVGKPQMVEPVNVTMGKIGRLMNPVSASQIDNWFIEGFEDMAPGTELTLRINEEVVRGTIDGRTFTVLARGEAIYTGTVKGSHPEYNGAFIDGDLPADGDNAYTGFYVKTWVPGYINPAFREVPISVSNTPRPDYSAAGWQWRKIWRYDGTSKTIYYMPEFMLEGPTFIEGDTFTCVGHVYTLPYGHGYSIVGIPTAHDAGSECYRLLDQYTWIVNEYPSARVNNVYVHGKKLLSLQTDTETVLNRIGLGGGVPGIPNPNWEDAYLIGQVADSEEDRDIVIHPEHYDVNLNDSQFVGVLGHNCTTITFYNPPKFIPGYQISTNDIKVDIEGLDSVGDGSGTVIENPAAVIKKFLETWGGVGASEIDMSAFSSVESATGWLRFGFALGSQRNLMDLCADMGFQARSEFKWEDGLATIGFLRTGAGSVAATITGDDEITVDSVKLSWDDFDYVLSEIVAVWNERGEEKELTVRDTAAEAAYGRRAERYDFWAYGQKQYVSSIASFWLAMRRRLRRRVSFKTYLTELDLQRGDWVSLDLTDYFLSGQKGDVVGLRHSPGAGADAKMDEIEFELRLPVWAGCLTACETECQTGCESVCEIWTQTGCEFTCEYACEGSCVNVCELLCAAAADQGGPPCALQACMVFCMIMLPGGAIGQETCCEMYCESQCESTGCETTCDHDCTSGSAETQGVSTEPYEYGTWPNDGFSGDLSLWIDAETPVFEIVGGEVKLKAGNSSGSLSWADQRRNPDQSATFTLPCYIAQYSGYPYDPIYSADIAWGSVKGGKGLTAWALIQGRWQGEEPEWYFEGRTGARISVSGYADVTVWAGSWTTDLFSKSGTLKLIITPTQVKAEFDGHSAVRSVAVAGEYSSHSLGLNVQGPGYTDNAKVDSISSP